MRRFCLPCSDAGLDLRRATRVAPPQRVLSGFLACLMTAGVMASSFGGIVITPQQSGSGALEFTWTGSLNLTGAVASGTVGGGAGYYAPLLGSVPGILQLRANAGGNRVTYATSSAPGTRFGTGTSAQIFSGMSGNELELFGPDVLISQGYVSGSPLSGTATFADYPYANAGLIPGTYTWTLAGSGDTVVMTVPVPEPTMCVMALAGTACAGFSVWGRRKRD